MTSIAWPARRRARLGGMPEWTDRIDPQVHLAWSGRWPSGTVEPPRILLDHELVVVAAGRCVVDIAGESRELAPGGFVIVPPAVVHHTRALAGPCTRHCLHFDWDQRLAPPVGPLYGFVSGRLPASRPRPAPAWVPAAARGGVASPAALAAAQRLFVHWRSGEHATMRAHALELLLLLFARREPAPAVDRAAALARAVKARLDQGGMDDASVRGELRRLGHSYEHLCRCFTRTYGIPPLRYVLLARIERAKVLLQEPGATVAAVARAVGYRDARHFSHIFRSVAGVLPGRWRR